MPTLNEEKYAALLAQGYTGTLNEMEWAWLNDQCGGGPAGPPVSSDPKILWASSTELVTYIYDDISVLNNIYWYGTGIGAGYHEQDFTQNLFPNAPSIDGAFNTGEYLVKYQITEEVSGAELMTGWAVAEDVWTEAFQANLSLEDPTNDGIVQEKVLKVWMATDNGVGVPVAGTETWRMVRFISSYEDAP